jgi:signal transduction histidine kinase
VGPRERDDVWRELLRAAPPPLLVTDPEGRVRLATEAAPRALGRAEEQVVGQRLENLLPTGLTARSSTVDGWRVVELPDGGKPEHLLLDLIRAQELERAQLAAGVHDDSLQVITAAMLRLQQLRHRIRDPETLEVLARLEETISLAADRLRRLIFDFRPPALERQGLAAALRDILSRMADETGVQVRLSDELDVDPPHETRLLLFRIAQEALTNVERHAQASRVNVQLSEQDGGYLVRVADDGVGVRPGQIARTSRAGHLGVTLMRERAEFAGGWFRLDSTPSGGTTVSVWVPDGRGLPAPRECRSGRHQPGRHGSERRSSERHSSERHSSERRRSGGGDGR